jgi:adenylate kinase
MRIAFTGSHGVGKTTVLTALQKELPNYTVQIESLTRKVCSSDKLNFETVDESEQKIVQAYYDLFKKAPKDFVSPRHIIDVMAYSVYLDKKNHNISDNTFEYIEELLLSVIEKKMFDLVVYIPIEFELKEKGEFRKGQEDLTYQRDVDIIIKFLLWQYDIPYITITGNCEQRVKQLVKIIKEKENK